LLLLSRRSKLSGPRRARHERDEHEIATMLDDAMHATMRDEREIATGDKTALQSPASWRGFLFG